MADDSLYDRRTLQEAQEGFQEFSRRFEELAGERTRPVDSIIRFLRGIPADDISKKKELAKYFQTQDGQSYNREQRRAAYDDLLGRERNRRTYG